MNRSLCEKHELFLFARKGEKFMKIRTIKDKDYTVMSNYHFKDKRISLRAKGLMSMMLSLPDEWTYSLNGLNSICTESKTTIRNVVKELKELHYLEVTEKRREDGKIYYEYYIRKSK